MIGPVLRALGPRYMDLRLRSGRGLVVRILERPGRWMPPEALAALSADLRRVAAKTLPAGSLTYGVFSGDPARLGAMIITLVSQRDGTPIAFNALAVMEVETEPAPTQVLHLGLVMVDPDARSAGLSWVLYGLTCFLLFVRNQFRPLWVSNVTQVPAVIGMVSEMFSDIWPAPGAGRRTLGHLILARRIMEGHRSVFGVGPEAGFDEDRFVITDAYTGGSDDLRKTWEAAPKHRKEVYNAFCADALDYTRGDDILQLGRIDLAAIRRYLARDVPRRAILGVILTGALAGLQRLILPVLYWTDTTRPFSILRPVAQPPAERRDEL